MQPYGLSLLRQYPHWYLLVLSIAIGSLIITGILYRFALTNKLLPAIRGRDVHTTRKPRVGGVAMWITAMVAFFLLAIPHSPFQHLSFGMASVWGIDRSLFGIIIGMVILLGFGLFDDIKGLSPSQQLLGQFLAATAIIWGGIQAAYIRLPFNGILYLNIHAFTLPSWLGSATIWPFSALFSYLWVIAMINVLNFFDGLDGLAGSISVTSAAVLFLVCLRLGFLGPATLALVVLGIALGFLPWNWYPSKLFMGTVGSQMLGFLLAVTAIISGAKVATAILVLGIPLLDALVVIGRRLIAHRSPFEADQRHLHHRLLRIGLPVPYVVLLINAVAVVFGLFALRTQNAAGKGILTLVLVVCMVLFILVTYLLERKVAKRVH